MRKFTDVDEAKEIHQNARILWKNFCEEYKEYIKDKTEEELKELYMYFYQGVRFSQKENNKKLRKALLEYSEEK